LLREIETNGIKCEIGISEREIVKKNVKIMAVIPRKFKSEIFKSVHLFPDGVDLI